MRNMKGIGFDGKLVDRKTLRACFIGCGSHSFRNVYPVLQFVPVELAAVCDLSSEKAEAFARSFGAAASYVDYHKMLDAEAPDAVFIVTNYDGAGRPRYPGIAVDCMNAGANVWMEKPPAGSVSDAERMIKAAEANGKITAVGFKKMFAPANVKAKELSRGGDFGQICMTMLQYPQRIPEVSEFEAYFNMKNAGGATSFLDHLCHPVSLLLMLAGMPDRMYYERAASGAGSVLFGYTSGATATLSLTHGAARNGGMERTMLISDRGRHIIVENNTRLSYNMDPPDHAYGASPNYFTGEPGGVSSVWEPEFSLGQLYNKALFILGYYNEINDFCNAALNGGTISNGTLEQAWQITHIFEKFAEGPRKEISLLHGI